MVFHEIFSNMLINVNNVIRVEGKRTGQHGNWEMTIYFNDGSTMNQVLTEEAYKQHIERLLKM